eukprot:873263_1
MLLIHQNEGETLVYKMLINQFNDDNEQNEQRQMIYSKICHEYLMTNNEYFVTILQVIASTLNPSLDPHEIATIARRAHLNGNMFVEGSTRCMNSLQFAKMFKTISNYNKKQWTRIYTTMKKWKMLSTQITAPTGMNPCNAQYEDIEEKTYEEEIKHNQTETDYIQQGTDEDIIQQFCSVTNATKDIAIQCLDQRGWDLRYAVQSYYNYTPSTNYIDTTAEISTDGRVYNHGVAFWYWTARRSNKRFVRKREKNLKDEMLQFASLFTKHDWDKLVDDCNALLKEEQKVKEMCSNGLNVEIYHQKRDTPIDCEHLWSIRLYTDYPQLCKILCEAFRRKTITNHQYERVESVHCRNEKVANWAKLLTESVQCYGTFRGPMTDMQSVGSKYYRGIDMQFMFKRFITRFNVPLSTTTNFTKATEFAKGGRGLVMELKIFNEYIPGLDCSFLSSFDRENEILFFGSDSIFHINTVYQHYNNTWTNYTKYLNQIEYVMNIANGSFSWNRKNNIRQILKCILESEPLPPYIESLLNYRLRHVPNTIEYDFRELKHSFEWVKHIFVNDDQTPNVSNACNLFKHCNHIRLQMGMDDTINMNNGASLIENMVNISNPNVAIEFQWT